LLREVKLLFISYINRSGSTFLANEFSKYESILVCPEAEILVSNFIIHKRSLYREPKKIQSVLSKIINSDPKLKYWNLKASDFSNSSNYNSDFDIFLDILSKYRDLVKPHANTIVFKAAKIAYFLNNIPMEYYEKNGIKIICLIRDGRAAYASQRETIGARSQKPMNKNPVKVAKLWRTWITFLSEHENDPRFLIIKYEEFLKDFRDKFNLLISDLEIFTESDRYNTKGDLFERIPQSQQNMHQNIQDPPIQDNSEKWRQILPPNQIALFEKLAGKELIQSGYTLCNLNSHKILVVPLYFFYCLCHWYQNNFFRKFIKNSVKFLSNKTYR